VYYPKGPLGAVPDAFCCGAVASVVLTLAALAVVGARAFGGAHDLALAHLATTTTTATTRTTTAAAAAADVAPPSKAPPLGTAWAELPAASTACLQEQPSVGSGRRLAVGWGEGVAATWLCFCLILAPTLGLDGGSHLCYLTADRYSCVGYLELLEFVAADVAQCFTTRITP
jgi:hypothetical protein